MPPKEPIREERNAAVLYHPIFPEEGIEDASQHLFQLIKGAQQKFPGKARFLGIDIFGHRGEDGAFDQDMYLFQVEVLLKKFLPFLTELTLPHPFNVTVRNPNPQLNEIPDAFVLEVQPTFAP